MAEMKLPPVKLVLSTEVNGQRTEFGEIGEFPLPMTIVDGQIVMDEVALMRGVRDVLASAIEEIDAELAEEGS